MGREACSRQASITCFLLQNKLVSRGLHLLESSHSLSSASCLIHVVALAPSVHIWMVSSDILAVGIAKVSLSLAHSRFEIRATKALICVSVCSHPSNSPFFSTFENGSPGKAPAALRQLNLAVDAISVAVEIVKRHLLGEDLCFVYSAQAAAYSSGAIATCLSTPQNTLIPPRPRAIFPRPQSSPASS